MNPDRAARPSHHPGDHPGPHRPDPDHHRTAEFWEDHYRRHDRVWSGRANAVLVEVAGALPAGRALDLGCGEGGDAIWLAQQGWQVAAVDVSATALARAESEAAAAGVAGRIEFARHDLAVTFPPGRFDLVSACYLHPPRDLPGCELLWDAPRAVVPGGLLLILSHASVATWSWGSDARPGFPTLEEVLAGLDLTAGEWRTERLERRERPASGPDGQSAVVADHIIVVRRLLG